MKKLSPNERNKITKELVDTIDEWDEWELREWAKEQMRENFSKCSDELLVAEYEVQVVGELNAY